MTPRIRGRSGALYVPSTPQHRYRERTAGTTDKRLLARMAAMLEGMKARQEWAPLNAAHEGRVTLAALYDAHQRNAVAALIDRASGVDLSPHVEPWLTTYQANGGAANNVGPYRQRVTAFVTPGPTPADAALAAMRGGDK